MTTAPLCSRRHFLHANGFGLGSLALASLLQRDGLLAAPVKPLLATEETYDLLPKQPHFQPRAKAMISLFMMGAGTLGVPRRHWDITFSDAELSFAHSAGAFLMMGLNGVFAILAAIGGAIFVIVVVGTVLFGTRIKGGHKLTFPLHSGGGAAVSHYGSHATAKLPGTAILVSIFFVSFALYYFINWKYLSELWLFR